MVSSNAGNYGVGGLRYITGVIYCYTNSAEWTPFTTTPVIAFTLLPTDSKFFANGNAYATATMEERTSQYFVADDDDTACRNWIAVGGDVDGLVFS